MTVKNLRGLEGEMNETSCGTCKHLVEHPENFTFECTKGGPNAPDVENMRFQTICDEYEKARTLADERKEMQDTMREHGADFYQI